MKTDIAQWVGFFGVILNFIIFQQKDRKRLLLTKLCSDAVWGIHYFLLGAYAGCAVAMVGFLREIVFYNKIKLKSKAWVALFVVVGVASALITQAGWYKIFPAIASALSVICFWQNKTSNSRLLALPVSACMMTYSFISGSVAGVINEIITIISVIIGILIIDRKKKLNKESEL